MEDKEYKIYSHIMCLYHEGKEQSWNTIQRRSIFRALYLASVLYAFMFESKQNPFAIYKFSIDKNGPYEKDISDAIEFLVKDDYLETEGGSDIYRLGSNPSPEPTKDEFDELNWIKIIVDILNIYGEDKIYEFIFRDPEYRRGLQSDTPKTLELSQNNKSIEFLKAIEQTFTESLKGKSLEKEEYVKLYFEFLFSKILNKEI